MTNADTLYADARTLFDAGRIARAGRRCRELLKEQPDHIGGLLLAARVAAATSQHAQALAGFQRAYALAPGDPGIGQETGDYLLATDNPQAALEVYATALAHAPESPEITAHMAIALQKLGRLDEAVARYQRAAELAPDDARNHYNLGTALKQLLRFDAAIDAYARAVALDPGADDVRMSLAVALLENGRFEAAEAQFETLAARHPNDASVFDYLSYVRCKLEKGDAAVRAARRLVALTPASLPSAVTLATAYLCAGDPASALTQAQRARGIAPGDRNALSAETIALTSLGRVRQANELVDFERFIRTRTLSPPAGYDSIEQFNKALESHVRGHAGIQQRLNSLSCHHGDTTGEILLEPKGPLALFESQIHAAAADYREALGDPGDHPWLRDLPDEWQLSAWMTTLNAQGFQHGHIHATAHLSGVYYVSLPPFRSTQGDTDPGCLELGRAPYYFACPLQRQPQVIHPHEGLLVLFPSFVYHRTIPFSAHASRVTIAFDFRAPSNT